MEFRDFLNKAFIKSYAQSDEVYADGFSYYKNGRVTHAVASKDKTIFQFTVKGNYNYKVQVRLGESLSCSCTCANLSKNGGICKHIIASLLFLSQFERTTKQTGELTAEEQRNGQILDYYTELDSGVACKETAHLEATFFYHGILRQPNDCVALRISLGAGRCYKVQSVKKMLEAVRSGQNFTLGKNFTYRSDICDFDESSQRVIEYLCELSDLEERFGIAGERSVFQKNEIMLTKGMFLEVLRRLGSDSFSLAFNNRVIENVTFMSPSAMQTTPASFRWLRTEAFFCTIWFCTIRRLPLRKIICRSTTASPTTASRFCSAGSMRSASWRKSCRN